MLFLAILLLALPNDIPVPRGTWSAYAEPAAAGLDVQAIAAARRMAEEADSAAVLAIRGGRVFAAWGDVARRYRCHSVRKSLLSALYGIHTGSGEIDLEETLATLGIDDLQGLTEREKQARVVDLLGARSGIYHPAAKEPADMSAGRPARESHAPGTHWWYNNWDFNTLGTIFESKTGTDVFTAFERDLARPLGMQDFRLGDGFFQLEPSKSMHAAYAFRLSARDLARIGLLFARAGNWDGAQLLPEDWVEESTAARSEFDGGAYGFMWWSYPAGVLSEDSGLDELDQHDKFAARGTGGQFLLVVPDLDFVFVHRGDTDNDRHVDGSAIWRIAETLARACAGPISADAETTDVAPIPFADPGPPPREREELPLAPDELALLTGEYEVAPRYVISIFEHEGRLFVRSPDGELELFREAEDRFYAKAHSLDIDFERDATGRAIIARGRVDGRDMLAKRR